MARSLKWQIVPLTKQHDRTSFDCGEPALNEWIQKYAGQSQELRIVKVYVLVERGDDKVLGYFALRAGQVDFATIPRELRKRLPRYPIPVVHLARLAVDRSLRGQGFGGDLLIAALEKSLLVADSIGAHALEVYAKNEVAIRFYEHYQFRPMLDDVRHLYLPMAVVKKLLGAQFQKLCGQCGEPMVFQGIDRLDNYTWICPKCNVGIMGHLTMQTIGLQCTKCRRDNVLMNRSTLFAKEVKVGLLIDSYCKSCGSEAPQEVKSIKDDKPEKPTSA